MSPEQLTWTDQDDESLHAFMDWDTHEGQAIALANSASGEHPLTDEQWAAAIVPEPEAEPEEEPVQIKGLALMLTLMLAAEAVILLGLPFALYHVGGWTAVVNYYAVLGAVLVVAWFAPAWMGGRR